MDANKQVTVTTETIADYHTEKNCANAAKSADKVFDSLGSKDYIVFCHKRKNDTFNFADDINGNLKDKPPAPEGQEINRLIEDIHNKI